MCDFTVLCTNVQYVPEQTDWATCETNRTSSNVINLGIYVNLAFGQYELQTSPFPPFVMIELNQFEPDINRAQVWKAIKVVPTIDGNMNICLCSRLHAHCSEQKQFILKHHEIHKLPANPNYNNRGIPKVHVHKQLLNRILPGGRT